MASVNLEHRRTHNILLISRLLNQRENASPLTLVLDTLEQPAKPLIKEYIRRAKVSATIALDAVTSPLTCLPLTNPQQISRNHTIFLSFETPHSPAGVDTFVPCWNKSPQQILQTVSSITATSIKRGLLMIDSLTSLSNMSSQAKPGLNLVMFLSALMQPPPTVPQLAISAVVVYHTDVPLQSFATPYSPTPLSLLSYIATTIITVHSLDILVAEKQARERSLGEPAFGLAQNKEGLMIGLKQVDKLRKSAERGIVLELEHRRKSGRGVLEWYFVPDSPPSKMQGSAPSQVRESVFLLDDHPLFTARLDSDESSDGAFSGVTFELSLTDRQRLERDGVVLPYFDAQQASGRGEGGRILYDMGTEDDFDEEEDEL